MGGRIAMELAYKTNFKLKKLVLINAHPGLESEEERSERSLFEDKIFERLQHSTQDEFMTWWNSLPLFKSDKAISTTPERFQKSAELFNRYRLSKQQNYLPMLGEYKDKVLFIGGLDDEKYMDLVSEKLIPLDIEIKGIQGGHRLFQKTTELTDLLKEEGIL
jgi:2-succinyl-6-hydroxy-2,4-cyclohexadiene-1-carboxylate synthase